MLKFTCLYFRYDIFCKAAYAWLKENTVTSVSAENCKNVYSPALLCFTTFLLAYHWNTVSQLGADALHAAISAVSKYGGASLGYRTLLDALIPAATCLKEVSVNINVMYFFIEVWVGLVNQSSFHPETGIWRGCTNSISFCIRCCLFCCWINKRFTGPSKSISHLVPIANMHIFYNPRFINSLFTT